MEGSGFFMKAKISEVFRSIQGEGKYLGVPQVFVRFFGCGLNCKICDTPQAQGPAGEMREYTQHELLKEVRRLSNDIHSVSLSGGEPLEQKDFLKYFLPLLKKQGIKTYLETNGTLPENLKEVISYIDIVSMDMKLPSVTGQKAFWGEHEKFLKIARTKEVFVKVVITLDMDLKEAERAAKLASQVNRGIVFILQPNNFEIGDPLIARCQHVQTMALKSLNDVRIIPQMHKVLGVRYYGKEYL
jgi:organic radical activating enzyme